MEIKGGIIIPSSMEEYKYLIGTDSFNYEVIVESTTNGETMPPKFRAISGRSNVQNGNGRTYGRLVLDAAFWEFYEKYVKADSGLGEIEHPTRKEDPYKVPFKLAAVKIVNLFKRDEDPDTWWGDYMPTSYGDGIVVAGLMRDRIKFGVSTRGFGRYKDPQTKRDIIEYHIRAIDVVMDPSTPGAFAESIKESAERIMESRSFIYDPAVGDFVEQSYDNLAKTLKVNANPQQIAAATSKFLNSLKGPR